MASIFEELMNQNRALTESMTSRKGRRLAKEARKISVNRIKVESRKIFEEEDLDEIDDKFSVDQENPSEDEVVLVIDPELPVEGEEEPEVSAEEMVGDKVYKCPVCGANYLCDCESSSVSVDEEGHPEECPICGDETEQILIGEIAPADDPTAGEAVDEDPESIDDNEDEEEPEVPEEVSEEEIEEEGLKLEEFSEDEEEVKAPKARTQREKDAIVKAIDQGSDVNYNDLVNKGIDSDTIGKIGELNQKKTLIGKNTRADAAKKRAQKVNDSYSFDERRFESFIASIIKENYKGTPKFRVTRVSSNGTKLKLEYKVLENGKITKGKMVAEGFTPARRTLTLKFKDAGVFTESFARTPSFIVECTRIKNIIVPTSVKYDYKVKVNESVYRVFGNASK